MEKRTLRIMFSKNGKGAVSYRINLPTPWINDLGVTEDSREVNVYKLDDQIIIISKEKIQKLENTRPFLLFI
ncbi:hypothetical protein IX317_000470 [Fusobacterium sp. DD29]|uniref:AbrB/MazE/SpoVT family DNA-binding domain-containing protein n=1 Tax=unclassified Fusobacterium TaxID=2648384 RepID=UPI001B8C4A03|nr:MULTISPECIES: AbrB/MazE/SpoVT family DNA-binding domain-containing protein [unclassified Fusobacterium]MBR8700220.1 hypothetical protein [Fusobacterium sp. DD45]MBR8710329.1 hypothetical protein [Fusobacterium sp. DD28]MBR8748809.1 hypothetical protein [Fusobacterium sp. DD29]MBR8750942.1 hypothetical protein [Fusobacterium sp. DD26]MBR8761034.1 hypothetical protein [Fusobacterium sp. DD25]